MSELPKGWIKSEIKSIATDVVVGFVGTSKTHYCESGVPFLTGKNIKNGKIDLKKIDHVTNEFNQKERKSRLSPGDVVVVRIGRSGEAAVVPETLPLSNCGGLVIIKKPLATTPEYVSHYLNSPAAILTSQLESRGATRQTLNTKNIAEKEIPLPPYAEQTRIVKKLNELLDQVDTLKARIDAIPTLLKRFRQSVLAAAVSGRLTEEWRYRSDLSTSSEDESSNAPPHLIPSWSLKKLPELGELARGKSKHRPRNDKRLFGHEYPFIQTGEIANSGGLIKEAKTFYSEFGLAQSRLFPKGTLCITIAANIADTAILDINACFPDSVVGFIPKNQSCELLFIKYFIDVNKQNLEAFAPATAQKNINLKVLSELALPLPSFQEQIEIVRRVEQLFAFADQLEAKVATAKARIDRLTQSILAKAFRGELVPQDPNDEPASALLERIQAQLANAPKAKRGREST
ncbi:restriction endonuclease subunit S [Metapseudomonas furukawaii]|uniref:restriction endonuclease subunit S n=1 Tax=Metapseudomonas furukawaii TaxID=1149133 RepID=UPI0040453A59